MRTFIALRLPDEFLWEASALARQLKAQVDGRFMAQRTYHVTLAFLGETDEAQRRAAMDALDAACERANPVRLAADGLGTFGKPSDATLWLGLARDEQLMQLAQGLRGELKARGIPFDAKPFRPHITLARRACMPKGALEPLGFPQPCVAEEVALLKSELTHEGARYKPLYIARLNA